MPLVLGFERGEDFYVGADQFVVEKIAIEDQVLLRRAKDGHVITVVSSRSSEILKGVTVSLGPRQSETTVRISINAPRNMLILRGDRYRENPPKQSREVSSRDFKVSPEAIAQARRLGLFGNVENRVIRMAKDSAPFTHPKANRRFESYILKIEGEFVVSIMKFDPSTGQIKTDVLGRIKTRK